MDSSAEDSDDEDANDEPKETHDEVSCWIFHTFSFVWNSDSYYYIECHLFLML